MKIVALLFLLSAQSWADESSDKTDLIMGEKFADQYFRPPPLVFKGVTNIIDVIGTAPEMRTGSRQFRAGAWYQVYVQSTATLNNIVSAADQDFIFKVELEQLWKIASTEVKKSGITPDQLASLTSDPDAIKLATDPDPSTWKQAQEEYGNSGSADSPALPTPQPPATDGAPKKESLQNSVYIFGTMSEKTPDGLLVACPSGFMVIPGRETVTIDRQVPGKPPPVYGMCFLKNFHDANKLIDGGTVETVAYPSDPYSYTATDGSTKTIPCYNASP